MKCLARFPMSYAEKRNLRLKLKFFLRPEYIGMLIEKLKDMEALVPIILWTYEEDDFSRFVNECMQDEPGALVKENQLRLAFRDWANLRGQRLLHVRGLIEWLNERSDLPGSNREWKDCILLPPNKWKSTQLSTPAGSNPESDLPGRFTEKELRFLAEEIRRRRPRDRQYESIDNDGSLDNGRVPRSLIVPPVALENLQKKESLEAALAKYNGKIKNHGDLLVLVEVMMNRLSPEDAIPQIRARGHDPSWVSPSDVDGAIKAFPNAIGDLFVLALWCNELSIVEAIALVQSRGFPSSSKTSFYRRLHVKGSRLPA